MRALVLAVVLAILSFGLPTAVADCVGPACTSISSGGSGSCEHGQAVNTVTVHTTAQGFHGVGLSTSCSGGPGYAYRSIAASGSSCTIACVSVNAIWYSWNWGSVQGCDAFVSVGTSSGAIVRFLGCPAGAPPGVPAIFP